MRKKLVSFLLVAALIMQMILVIPATPAYAGAWIVTNLGSGFDDPRGVAVDSSGNIYVTEPRNDVIKKMDANGNNITVLGSGFDGPCGIAVDSSGYIFVGDVNNNAIKKMDANGNNITTLGSGFMLPYGIALDISGNIYVADIDYDPYRDDDAVKRMDANGNNITVLGSGFNAPYDVAVNGSGNIYVLDAGDDTVKRMDANGNNVTTLASGFYSPYGIAVDSSGYIYVADTYNSAIKRMDADGANIITIGSGFDHPYDVAVDSSGNIYVADSGNDAIKKISWATTVDALALDSLVTAPVTGAAPNTAAIDQTQYTGTVAWYESDGITPVAGSFAESTVYAAKVDLTAKAGYTFDGVAQNSFTYTGATSVTNAADSGTVTITFPATADTTLPTVTGVTPGGTGAPVSGNIAITFSEAMNNTVSGAVYLSDDGGATYGSALTGGSWSVGDTVYTIGYSGLSYSTVYTVKIEGFEDAAGNVMTADSTHSFTTCVEPLIPSVSPGTLTVDKGGTASFTVAFGQGAGMATSADITVANGGIASVSQAQVTTPGSVTVTGLAVGTTDITLVFNDTASTTATVSVTVQAQSSGGSGGTPSKPVYTADVKAGITADTTLPVTVNTDTGSAAVNVGTQEGNTISGGGSVTVTMPSIPDVSSYTLSIPVAYLSTPDGKGILIFNTDTGSLTLPEDMLSGIAGEGSKVEIAIAQGEKEDLPDEVKAAIGNKPLIQLTLSIDGKQTNWSNPGAPVTVSIPYTPTPEELARPEHITVWYIDGSGKAVSMDGRYDSVSGTVIFSTTHFSYYAVVYDPVTRLAGTDRVATALRIAQAAYPDKISHAVLATADNYPDALAGSVLAHQLNAPILLIASSDADQEKVIAYLKANLEQEGTVYILGGTAVVGNGIEEKIQNSGFKHITRLAGKTRYDTAVKITEQLNVNTGTPVVLVSGENYPDALAVSSIAAQDQFPILLVQKDGISEVVSQKLAALTPSKIYIIGLEGAISPAVESQAAKLSALSAENIVRIGGADRYATSLAIAEYFNLGSQTMCIATGNNFPDALAGSVYAAKYKAPIILTDSSLSAQTAAYVKSRKPAETAIFGGEAVIGKDIEQLLKELLSVRSGQGYPDPS